MIPKSRSTYIGIAAAFLLMLMAVVPAIAAVATNSVSSVTLKQTTTNSSTYVSNSVNNTVTVTVKSSATETGNTVSIKNLTRSTTANTITATLTASGSDFVATFKVVSTATSQAAGEIQGLDGDSIQVVAGSRAASITVDAAGPVLSNPSPSDKSETRASTIQISGTVSDSRSGIGSGSGSGLLTAVAGKVTLFQRVGSSGSYTNLGNPDTVSDLGGGSFRVTYNLALDENDHEWFMLAADNAGNVTSTDQNTANACSVTSLTTAPGSGCDPYRVTIDRTSPQLAEAQTGYAWDASTKTLKTNVRNSIMVTFQEGTNATADLLEGSTVTTSVFLVDGVAPTAVVFPNVAPTGTTADQADLTAGKIFDVAGTKNATTETRHLVFLTLASDLASDATPTVEVRASSLTDKAGNPVVLATATKANGKSKDRIGPSLSVTVTGSAGTSSRPAATGTSSGSVTVTVVSDEEISASTINIRTCELVATTDVTVGGETNKQLENEASCQSTNVVATTTNTYVKTFTASSAGSSVSKALISAYISGSDLSGNSGAKGSGSGDGSRVDLTRAVLWEFDNELATPTATVTPVISGTTTESSSPFVRIDFAEGAEYSIGGRDNFLCGKGSDGTTRCTLDNATTAQSAQLVGTAPTKVEVDSLDSVTLTKLTLDGTDVLANAGAVDSDSFVLATSGLSVGTHTVVVNGKDALGNTLAADFSFTFTVQERAAYKVSLSPGWNLISLPSTPTDPSIDSVVPSSHPATDILTYENGVWKIATRGSDGKWQGSLKQIDGLHAYWVKTGAFTPIQTLIPERDAATLLPTIKLVKGWNMIPASDVTQQKEGTNIADANVYLASASWTILYSFNTTTNAWTKVVPNAAGEALNAAEIQTGKGYWLWATADGTLVP